MFKILPNTDYTREKIISASFKDGLDWLRCNSTALPHLRCGDFECATSVSPRRHSAPHWNLPALSPSHF